MRLHLTTPLLLIGLASGAAGAGDNGYTAEDARLLDQCLSRAQEADGSTGNDTRASASACIDVASAQCQQSPAGATTLGIVACLDRETAWWDERLNAHYQDLQTTLDADLASALQTAQRAWIGFRDADCAFAYAYWQEGSIRSVAFASCVRDATAARAIALGEITDWAP